MLVDLTKTPAQISGRAGITGASVQTLRPYLPPALTLARGYFSAAGTFQASGLAHSELVRTLHGTATVQLESVSLGDFNPVRTLARRFGIGPFEAGPEPLLITGATAHLQIHDRQVALEDFPVDIAGAEFRLQGSYAFDGSTRLQVRADLSGIRRPLMPLHPRATGPASRMADLHFAGTLRDLEAVPSARISQNQP